MGGVAAQVLVLSHEDLLLRFAYAFFRRAAVCRRCRASLTTMYDEFEVGTKDLLQELMSGWVDVLAWSDKRAGLFEETMANNIVNVTASGGLMHIHRYIAGRRVARLKHHGKAVHMFRVRKKHSGEGHSRRVATTQFESFLANRCYFCPFAVDPTRSNQRKFRDPSGRRSHCRWAYLMPTEFLMQTATCLKAQQALP